MNILLLCHEYPPLGGGGGIGARQYAEAWSQQGHKVTVLTSWRPGLKLKEIVNGAGIVRVPTVPVKSRATFSIVAMLSYVASGLLHIVWNFRTYSRTDIINTHFSLPGGLLGMIARRLLGAPNVLTIIGGDIYDPTKRLSPHRGALSRAANSMVMNGADRIVAISSDTKRNAERYYNVRKKIDVVNYGFLAPALATARDNGRRRDQYHLIAIGRLVERKGFTFLIEAMAQLNEDIILNIVGDGPLESRLRRLAEKYRLNGRIRLHGYVSRERVWEHLLRADCFVLSSLHEGMGIVVQEAMYAGLPIVSTDNGGQVDLIENYRNGILVKPEDAAALAGAIREIYQNKTLAERLGRNNREDIKRHLMPANAAAYIELFGALCHKEVNSCAAEFTK